jgi:hypothetical protein
MRSILFAFTLMTLAGCGPDHSKKDGIKKYNAEIPDEIIHEIKMYYKARLGANCEEKDFKTRLSILYSPNSNTSQEDNTQTEIRIPKMEYLEFVRQLIPCHHSW